MAENSTDTTGYEVTAEKLKQLLAKHNLTALVGRDGKSALDVLDGQLAGYKSCGADFEAYRQSATCIVVHLMTALRAIWPQRLWDNVQHVTAHDIQTDPETIRLIADQMGELAEHGRRELAELHAARREAQAVARDYYADSGDNPARAIRSLLNRSLSAYAKINSLQETLFDEKERRKALERAKVHMETAAVQVLATVVKMQTFWSGRWGNKARQTRADLDTVVSMFWAILPRKTVESFLPGPE